VRLFRHASATAHGPIRPFVTAPVAARMPSAIGRSNEVPSFRRSAGASRSAPARATGRAKARGKFRSMTLISNKRAAGGVVRLVEELEAARS